MTILEIGDEHITCNLCGADEANKLFSIKVPEHHIGKFSHDEWNIVRCSRCGLVYVNPRPDARAIDVFYSLENPVDHRFVQDWFIECADSQRSVWTRFVRTIQRYCPSGQLLDVGCGAGTFLVEARRAGYDVAGQDVAPFFIEYCQVQQGLTIYAGDLEQVDLGPGSFDCVTAFDVIEHHPDPKQMLRKMYSLLKPGGLAVVSTHDIGNWFARLYGPQWRHMHFFHLTYFTRETLAAMLKECGFQVVHCGGLHTIDQSWWAELRNWVVQFFKVIVLRALILGIYKPIALRVPALTHWQFKWGGAQMNHDKLMMRAGKQIIMDDDMVFLARAVQN